MRYFAAILVMLLPLDARADLSLSASTFFGGSQFERAQGVAVDAGGFVYIAGNTASTNLPTTAGAFQRSFGGGNADGYVAKFSPDLRQLIWATYLGGAAEDRAYDLVVDSTGVLYVAVWTASSDFPTTPGAYDTTHNSPGIMDVAYVKLRADGSGLLYSTFVGGSNVEQSRNSIAVDSAGALYSTGYTNSPDFPTTTGAFQRSLRGGHDAFIFKLSPNGSQLVFSTLFGGSGNDEGFAKAQVHSDGSVYFGGTTRSTDLPVSPSAFQRTYGGDTNALSWHGDAFVARINSTGTALIFSTYLGGSSGDELSVNDGFAIDSSGRAIVIGNTTSSNFPVTASAFQKNFRGGNLGDAFVAILSADGSQLLHSTLFGGTGSEESSGIAVGPDGCVYFSGNTESVNLPTTAGAQQLTHRGGSGNTDAFLVKLAPDLSTLRYSSYLGGSGTNGGFGDRGRAVVLGPGSTVIVVGDVNSPDFPLTPTVYDTTHNGVVDAFIARFTPVTATDLVPPAAPGSFR